MTSISSEGYRVISALGHPMADRIGRAYEHRVVLYDRIGPGPHRCVWCGDLVSWRRQLGYKRLVVDHLDERRLNNNPENLAPSCTYCNSMRQKQPDFLTHCINGHEFTPENTYLRLDGRGRRHCRKCKRARDKTRREASHA